MKMKTIATSVRRLVAAGLVATALLGSLTSLAKSAAAQAPCSWTGDWQTTFPDGGAVLHLTQNGNQVTGTYEFRGGRLRNAYVEGDVLAGDWYHTEDSYTGSFAFRIDGTCNSFIGQYTGDQEAAPRPLHHWNGTRIGGANTQPVGRPTIRTDRPSYREGDDVTICFAVPRNGNVVITDTLPGGAEAEVVNGFIARGEYCIQWSAGPGKGTERLRLEFFSPDGDATVETTFSVT